MTLAGKRILITRPADQSVTFAAILESHGARPILFPTIEISPARDPGPLDRALENLQAYDWLIFTSANAVDAVWKRRRLGISDELPKSLRVAAVGPKTAWSLRVRGVEPHFVPDTYVAEAIVPGLGNVSGRRFLLPMADIAHGTLPAAIEGAGGHVEVVTAYHTVPAQVDDEGLRRLQQGVDAVTLTSGSTVRNLVSLIEAVGLDPQRLPGAPIFACIGPKTARSAEEAGFRPVIRPDVYTVEGMVETLEAYFSALEEGVR